MQNKTTLFLKNNIVSILLITAIFSSVIYIYACGDNPVFIGMSLVSLIYFFLLFGILDVFKNAGKKWISTIGEITLLFLSVFIGSSCIETSMADTANWFFNPDDFPVVYTGNILAIIITVGFVLGSSLFYFTRIQFRIISVFLICICPFALFAKSFTDIPVIFIIIIITLFFLLIIINAINKSVFSGRNKTAAVGAFIIAVSVAAAFFPKLNSAPYREQFDELITGINISGAGRIDFNAFSDTSSASSKPSDKDKVLFRISGDNPRLIKRQCFVKYNPETYLWEYTDDADTGYNNFNNYIKWENPQRLSSELGKSMDTKEGFSIISSSEGKIHAIYTAENTTSIDFLLSSDGDFTKKNVYRTPYDEYFISNDISYESYAIYWHDFDIDVDFMLAYDDETAESVGKTYSTAYLNAKEEMLLHNKKYLAEDVRKACYKSEKSYEKIKALTAEITADCRNDYAKALAIQNYFLSDDFVYDIDFMPTDGSPENFIFNTKRGSCTDYATAMTLLCREAGLYSRYVEGFLIQHRESDGSYTVTAADSHAYVQVWLDGYGWTDFDPTSSNPDGGYIDPTFIIFGICMLVLGIGGALFFVLRPVFAEIGFLKRAKRLRGGSQLMLIYPKISRIIHKESGCKRLVMTEDETAAAAYGGFGVDLSELCGDFKRAYYGGEDCGSKNYISVYTDLKKAVKKKKAEKKREKKKKR